MRAKSVLRLIPVLALAYAAGWFSRRAPASAAAGARGPLVLEAGVARGSGPAVQAPAGAPGTGGLTAEARPLTSLAEVLGLLGGIDGDGGELAILPLMDLLPRLMITDAPTVRRMLEELAADTTLDRNADFFPMAAGGLVFRWMLIQPEEAAGFMLKHHERLGDFADMAPFLVAWAERTRSGAGERLLAEVPEEDREDMGEILHQQALMADPAKTLRDPAAVEKLDRHDLNRLTARWQAADPAALLAWRAGLPPEGAARESADSAILQSLPDPGKDPAAAEARLAALPPDLADRGRLKLLADGMGNYHHQAEGSSPPPPDPAALAARLDEVLARHALPAGELQSAAAAAGKGFIRDERFAEGARWSLTLPEDGGVRREAVGSLVTPWIQHDSASASAWINSLPAGALRDSAADRLIDAIRSEDPENALVWARSLSGAGDRRKAIAGVYREWFETDAAAASQAVLNLPPEERASLKKENSARAGSGDEDAVSGNAIDALIEKISAAPPSGGE